jgi:hypothetical protein
MQKPLSVVPSATKKVERIGCQTALPRVKVRVQHNTIARAPFAFQHPISSTFLHTSILGTRFLSQSVVYIRYKVNGFHSRVLKVL